MRLLFILQDLPFPPSNGYRQKVFNLISYLRKNNQCDIICFSTAVHLECTKSWLETMPGVRVVDMIESKRVPFLRVKQAAKFLFSATPVSWIRHRSRELAERAVCRLREGSYDLVHVDLIGLAQYCPKNLGFEVATVLSLNDSMGAALMDNATNPYMPTMHQIRYRILAHHQRRIDRRLSVMANALHFVGMHDTEFARRWGCANAVHIPLAVDPDFQSSEPRRVSVSQDGRKIIIIEKMWEPHHRNALWAFLVNYWRRLADDVKDCSLIVIGGAGMPERFVQQVALFPRVQIVDWVEDLPSLLWRAELALFLNPVAVGMKTRVLQCMAAGLPIIGSPAAFSGMPVRDGLDVLVAKSLDEFSVLATKLLRCQGECARLSDAGWSIASKYFTRAVVGAAWDRLHKDVLAGNELARSYASYVDLISIE